MNKVIWAQNALRYAGIGIVAALVVSIVWDSSDGIGGSEIFTGIALLLAIGSILYLKSMQDVSERDVTRRIRTEYSPENQKVVFDVYRQMKTKELEGLFSKILDDANGDASKVKKLASVAESIGWKAFIENEW
jgi:hypothetical protein